MSIRNTNKGFTLIELIVVIGIIGILSAMVIAVLNPLAQFAKARDTQRKTDLALIQKGLEQYYQDMGQYPSSSTGSTAYEIIGVNKTPIAWGSTDTNNWPYSNTMPKDPDSSRTYVYYSTGQTYWLYASLERGSQDPQACNGGNACSEFSANVTGFPGKNTCGNGSTQIVCNYGVSSPNTTP